MLARFEAADGEIGVGRMGRRNDDRLNVGRAEQAFEIQIDLAPYCWASGSQGVVVRDCMPTRSKPG
jgi:hypothetical protein